MGQENQNLRRPHSVLPRWVSSKRQLSYLYTADPTRDSSRIYAYDIHDPRPLAAAAEHREDAMFAGGVPKLGDFLEASDVVGADESVPGSGICWRRGRFGLWREGCR
jgi:hypothetical protein